MEATSWSVNKLERMKLLAFLLVSITLTVIQAEDKEEIPPFSLEGDDIDVIPARNLVAKKVGEPLSVTCKRGESKVFWKAPEGVKIEGSNDKPGPNELKIKSLTPQDAGIYTCQGVGTEDSIAFTLRVNSPSNEVTIQSSEAPNNKKFIDRVHDPQDKKEKRPPLNINLTCTCTTCGDATPTWYHNDVKLEGDRFKMSAKGGLYINYATPLDSGYYSCSFGNDKNASFLVESIAYVKKTHFASKNVMQGGDVTIDCQVFGSPPPTIEWFRREKDDGPEVPLNTKDDRISLKSFGGIENASLTIVNLDFKDRAKYICNATNDHGSHWQEILVRVKDKLAALWPFLGIVIEVVVLVAIIFFYEKRKAKRDSEEETTAGEQKRALTDENVRQRPVKA